MSRSIKLLVNACLLACALAIATSSLAFAASPPEPTYGTADVNGNTNEWVSGDFFAYTYWTGSDPTRKKAEVYLRYDCVSKILWVRVRGYSDIYYIDADPGDLDNHFVYIDGSLKVNGSTGDNNSAPDFAYQNQTSGRADSWEASIPGLNPGNHTIQVGTVSQVIDGGTSDLASLTNPNSLNSSIALTLKCYDYGDLPNNYAVVTNSENGGRHLIGNLFLGLKIDAENDGQHSASALGDDNAGLDDEDGVVRTPAFVWFVGTNGGKIDIFVTGTGCFYGWINWNKDNDLNDTGELIINNLPVTPGDRTITFNIPAGTTLSGNFFARFRLYPRVNNLCTSVTGSPTGTASNGEVEDYVWDPGIPTAVTVTSLSARAGAGWLSLALGMSGVFILGALAVALRRQH